LTFYTDRAVERCRVCALRHASGGGAGDQASQRHNSRRRGRTCHRQVRQQSDVPGVRAGRGDRQEQRSKHSWRRRRGGSWDSIAIVHSSSCSRSGRIPTNARPTTQSRHRQNQVGLHYTVYRVGQKTKLLYFSHIFAIILNNFQFFH